MKTAELFKEKIVFSYEVFPAKQTSSVDTIFHTLGELKDLEPDFISVTYGAGGRGENTYSFEIAKAIKDMGIEGVAHLPCYNLGKDDVKKKLRELQELGVENILALRGDIPEGGSVLGDFEHASDLISFIKSQGDFNVIAACYPEGHIESSSKVEDILNLKIKVDAGADQLITQLFMDNDDFYAFRERCELAGIDVPIQAGIMPVTNKKQIERLTKLSGAKIPLKFRKMLERFGSDPLAMRDAGIAYAVDQIVDLITRGVDGIHIYTMNKPIVARRIHDSTINLTRAVNALRENPL